MQNEIDHAQHILGENTGKEANAFRQLIGENVDELEMNDMHTVYKCRWQYRFCHPERNEVESKDLRTFDIAKQIYRA